MAEVQQGGGGGKEKGGKVRAKKASTKIDMTPMVDLAFLLLTFFMLTATFNKPKTMELNMPDKPDPNDDKPPEVNVKKVVSIVLEGNDKIYYWRGVDGQPTATETNYSSSGIRKVIMDEDRAVSATVFLIKPSDKSRYKNLVDVLDEMAITKAQRYAIVDYAPEDEAIVKGEAPAPTK